MMIDIDGSYGEGGGQIIRTALSMAAILNKPITINNIRANRSNSGLRAQHLTACLAVNKITNGFLQYAEIGSRKIIFQPKHIHCGEYEFQIGTAGSTILVAQTLLPILIHGKKPSRIILSGGTHIIKSPSYDYFSYVFLPALKKFGVKAQSKLLRSGYFPKGGGSIILDIEPCSLTGVMNWERSNKCKAVIRLANLPEHIAQREKTILLAHGIENIQIIKEKALCAGNAITCWCGHCGTCSIGEKGKPAEKVAEEAVNGLIYEDIDVDPYLADQLAIYASLAKGDTRYQTSTITQHFTTNFYIINKFLARKISIQNNCALF